MLNGTTTSRYDTLATAASTSAEAQGPRRIVWTQLCDSSLFLLQCSVPSLDIREDAGLCFSSLAVEWRPCACWGQPSADPNPPLGCNGSRGGSLRWMCRFVSGILIIFRYPSGDEIGYVDLVGRPRVRAHCVTPGEVAFHCWAKYHFGCPRYSFWLRRREQTRTGALARAGVMSDVCAFRQTTASAAAGKRFVRGPSVSTDGAARVLRRQRFRSCDRRPVAGCGGSVPSQYLRAFGLIEE